MADNTHAGKRQAPIRSINRNTLRFLVCCCLLNMAADLILFRGYHGNNLELTPAFLRNVSLADIRLGGLLGLISIPPLLLIPSAFGRMLEAGNPARRLLVSATTTYILGCLAYHIGFAFTGSAIHLSDNEQLLEESQFLLTCIGLYTAASFLVLTASLLWLRFRGTLYLPAPAIACLPFFSTAITESLMIAIDFGSPLGGYLKIVSGTLPLLLFSISLSGYRFAHDKT